MENIGASYKYLRKSTCEAFLRDFENHSISTIGRITTCGWKQTKKCGIRRVRQLWRFCAETLPVVFAASVLVRVWRQFLLWLRLTVCKPLPFCQAGWLDCDDVCLVMFLYTGGFLFLFLVSCVRGWGFGVCWSGGFRALSVGYAAHILKVWMLVYTCSVALVCKVLPLACMFTNVLQLHQPKAAVYNSIAQT
jgi:hypothetical protein